MRVGLTGGIASGKSTVARMFGEFGAFVINADAVVHELLAPGGAAEREVAARFGSAIVGPSGAIDRRLLGAIVFADPVARGDLETFVHPLVRAEIARRITSHATWPSFAVAVVEAALLVETGAYREYDAVVVTTCPVEVRVRRLVDRDGVSERHARERLAAQTSDAERSAVADFVIDTSGTLDRTREQVATVWARLRSA